MRKLTGALISLVAVSLMAIVLTGAGVVPNGLDQDTPLPPEFPDGANTAAQLSSMIERVLPSVVNIYRYSPGRIDSQGSGVIFRVENNFAYIITNQHVVGKSKTVEVIVQDTFYGIAELKDSPVLAVDYKRDLAVVRITCAQSNQCIPAEFGDSLALNVGDPVVAIGFPRSEQQPQAYIRPTKVILRHAASVTQGIVSAFRSDSRSDRQLVQHDAPTNPGSSGGPLFNLDGQVIGINTFELRGSESLNYAVLETTVQNRLPDLMAGRSSGSPSLKTALVPIYGPMAGHLHHEPEDNAIELSLVPVLYANMYIGAWFKNPYTHGGIFGRNSGFSYGFMLRSNNAGHLRVYVSSDGNWRIVKYSGGAFTTLASGPAPSLRLGKGQYNRLLVGAIDDQAVMFLNLQQLTAFNGSKVFPLGGHTDNGWTWIATGFGNFDEYTGQITSYSDFRIAIPVSAELSDDGTIPPAAEEWMSQQHQDSPPPGPEQHSHGPSTPPQEQAKPDGQ